MTRSLAAFFTLVLLLAPFGCGPRTPAEKRARIDELFARYQKKFPDAPAVTIAELLAMQERGPVVLVDVREADEQSVSMIPGAITQKAFERTAASYRNSAIVAYCTIGNRSGTYTRKLRKRGFAASNLKGSILSWTHAGRDFHDPQGRPTRRLHVYGRTWDLAADGYETTW
jgi:rhodanese-related sulfurtransferase